ncbi:MAG TPA: nucleotidyltransferase domain-containing protein [Candidatus Eisenbacteria bacterium]|nr:nucleotidyltransferase domain-containing protein [Candidatus Eisenbacteria bacterium]
MRDILHEALTSLKDRIKLGLLYGSIARGEEKASSDVDLMVVGEISFSDVVFCIG